MPEPLSLIETRIILFASGSVCIMTRSFFGEYLMALDNKFVKTCKSRSRSTHTLILAFELLNTRLTLRFSPSDLFKTIASSMIGLRN